MVKAFGLGVQKWTEVERSILGSRAEKDLMNEWTVGRRRQGFGWKVKETPHTSKVVINPEPNISSGESGPGEAPRFGL